MRAAPGSSGGPPRHPPAVSRRALLAAGLCAAAGCGRRLGGPAPPAAAPSSASAASLSLTVCADVLFQARDALTAAWTASHPGVRLVLRPTYSGSPPAGTTYADAMQEAADVLQVEGDGAAMGGQGVWPDLSELVKEHNFDLAALPAAAVAAFTGSTRLYGLPVRLVPFAMTVDAVALAALHAGTASGGPIWTWSDLRAAVERAASAAKGGATRPIVSGTGWADVRVWGAFVSGLGGDLVSSGALDLTAPATVAAAGEFLGLAGAAGWPAVTGESGPGVAFVPTPDGSATAAGSSGAPLFVIAPLLNGLAENLALPRATRFPLLPSRPLVPVAQVDGLALSHESKHAEHAVAFMLWLYSDAAQTALIGAGVPPVAGGPDLETAWARAAARHASTLGAYDVAHTVDVLDGLPTYGPHNYTMWLRPWLEEAAAHPGQLAPDLRSAEQTVNRILAAGGARVGSACAGSDPLCGAPAPP